MHPYFVVLVVACVACAAFGTSVLVRDPRERANQLAAAMIFGGAWWAFCEVMWTQAHDPETALAFVKLSALGWVWIGPLALHLMMELVGDSRPGRVTLVRALYAASALYFVIGLMTSAVHTGVVLTEWGWSYELGPLYPFFYVTTVSALGLGLSLAYRAYQSWPSEAERRQARGIAIGIMIPLVVASATDGLLPYFGVQVWHMGTASIAVLGATIALTFHRYGYSLLAPGTFAREILDTMTDGLALLHLDGRIRRANPALARMAGAPCAEQLIGLRIGELVDEFDGALPEIAVDRECRFSPLVGPALPVLVSTSQLVDRQGAPTGIVVLLRDLREIVYLRQRLVISGRMVAVGQLAAGVAHELNNPMAYVRSNLSLLQTHCEKLGSEILTERPDANRAELFAECGELLEESVEGVDRATSIIRDIRNFSHAGTAEREETDVRDLLDVAQRMVEPQIRERAVIERRDAAVPPVLCAPREIQQVFVNLFLNAADARAPDGAERKIAIRVDAKADDDFVAVTVSDDGVGIEPDALDCIFDPFYTTKPAGQGTGLGLAISYEIVRRHGGELKVESARGRGARFTLSLPR